MSLEINSNFYPWLGSIVEFENPDVRNHPRINPRIFDIIRKFWGRVGCEKIDVRWGTRNDIKVTQKVHWNDSLQI